MLQPSRTILIVDDSPEDRELYRRYLLRDREYSYTALEATLGRQGLDLWQQYQPDVVLLDYRLPDLDGVEFLAQLQSLGQQTCLPVIMVTGQGNEAIAVQAMKAGAQDYLVKEQITPEGLHLAVNGAVETVQLRAQLQQRIQRERLVAQISQNIHHSLDLAQILQTTVNEVRQFLQTDRVLIFRVQPDGSGTVITESVGAEWTPLLSTSLYDPCFHENYIESFRQGLVTIKPDIHNANINPCHVELLVKLQVRANLVVPILQDNQLWGMLIAHHCATPRQWESLEVDLLKELATQLGIALQQAELYQQAQSELAERRRVEAALRESEERFRQLAENIDAVFWMREVCEDCISYISPACERLWQINPRELMSKSRQAWISYVHPEDRESIAKAFRTKAAAGEFDEEYRIVLADGSIRWLRDRCFPLLDRTGKIYRFAGIAEDITEHKQAEQALRENEQLLRLALQGAQAGSWDWEIATGKVMWSSENYALYGLEPKSISPNYEHWYNALHPDDRERTSVEVSRVIEQCLPEFRAEFRIVRPQGDVAWLMGLGRLTLDEQGKPTRLSGINLDISDRKQAEEALRQSEEFKSRILESSSDCIKLLNLDGQILYMNPGGTCLLEIEDITVYINKSWTDFWQADNRIAVEEAIATAKIGDTRRFQGFCVTAKGTPKWWDVVVTPIFNANGQIVQLLATSRDITERQQAEQERIYLLEQEQVARAEAERANRIKDEFLAILSHELRSPLNPILGWSRLLQTRNFSPDKTAEALATIERNAKLQTQLIDDLLDIAKILRGKLSMNVAPVNLVYVIESAMETVRAAAVAKSIFLQPVLPEIGQVSGDAVRLQQIIWNLLSNAIKFTPNHGRVEIRLERIGEAGGVGEWGSRGVGEEKRDKADTGDSYQSTVNRHQSTVTSQPSPIPIQNCYAQITISDTGKGIKSEFLPLIFESFRQEDASTTRKFGGLGLGLAIARYLVEAHGGTIWADSKGEGQGTTFTVQLPLLAPEPQSHQSEKLWQQELDLTGIRVLTVDDEPDTRQLLTELLIQYRASVLTVESATEVLLNLESFQPDVLISDIGMPEMDGYTLIQQIRALSPEKGGQIPAIALTAYAREDDRQLALTKGYQDYITKPLEPEQLVQAIMSLAVKGNRERGTGRRLIF